MVVVIIAMVSIALLIFLCAKLSEVVESKALVIIGMVLGLIEIGLSFALVEHLISLI